MTLHVCDEHKLSLEIDGNIRRIRYKGAHIPSGCTLPHMREPQEIKKGELWTHPTTGRSAYSNCTVREVK